MDGPNSATDQSPRPAAAFPPAVITAHLSVPNYMLLGGSGVVL